MKKLCAIVLSLLLLFSLPLTLSACTYYSDEETAAIVDEVLTKEADLNRYIYLNAFQTEEDPGDDVNSTYQHYYTVHPDSKYRTISALKDAVNEVIASVSREEIYAYAFDGLSSEDNSVPPRFASDEDGYLQINVSDNAYSQMRSVYRLGSAKAKRSNQTHIKAVITVIRYDKDGNPREAEKEVELLLEDGQWRLVSQTMIIGVTDSAS